MIRLVVVIVIQKDIVVTAQNRIVVFVIITFVNMARIRIVLSLIVLKDIVRNADIAVMEIINLVP